MTIVRLIQTHFLSWWHCHRRLQHVVSQLTKAGVHHRDPVFPLIREISLVPDRMLRVVLAILGVVTVSLCCGGLIVAVVFANDHVTVLKQAHGDLLLIRAPSGSKTVACPPEFVCLFIPKS